MGDHEDELPDDQVELNQDERKQDEMELIVLADEVRERCKIKKLRKKTNKC